MVILQHMLLFSFKYLISLASTVLIIFCFAGSVYCPLLYYQSQKGKSKVISFQILIKQNFKRKGKERRILAVQTYSRSSQFQLQPTPNPHTLINQARWREIWPPAPTTPRRAARAPARRRGTASSATAPRRASTTCRRFSPTCSRRARRAAPPTPPSSKRRCTRCLTSGARSSAWLPQRPPSRHVPPNPSPPSARPFLRDSLLL
jgi:hypothetical protein